MIFPRLYSEAERQKLKNKRLHIEGSPKVSVTIADLSALAQMLYGWEDDNTVRKFLPLNYLRIHNKSGCRLKVYVGQKSGGEVIDDDTIWTYHGNFWTFLLENMDTGSTATGASIFVNAQRLPDGG
jgi:hypothetical protein